jgi:polyphosphate kinase
MKTAVYRTSGTARSCRPDPVCRGGEAERLPVELKARFDEHRNIEWSRALEQAGRARRLRLPDQGARQ